MKKIVHYSRLGMTPIEVGRSAFVFPTDHPKCSNRNMVQTSTVIALRQAGEFETLNSIYVPKGDYLE